MKKGQIAEGNVTTVEFPNKGIVMTDEEERVIEEYHSGTACFLCSK